MDCKLAIETYSVTDRESATQIGHSLRELTKEETGFRQRWILPVLVAVAVVAAIAT
jgi:hypothetical protein